MTIGATGGYVNLAQGNAFATIYSKDVQKFFRRNAVVQDITNTDYFGEIANMGDTVNIIKEPTITVSAYNRGLNLQTQELVDDQIQVTVDQSSYFQFAVDDVEKKVAHHNWTELAIGAAAYAIRDDYDSTVLTYMKGQAPSANISGSDSATATGDITSTSAGLDLGYDAGEISPLRLMARAARLLDDQNVPEEGRWFAAAPEFYEVLSGTASKLLSVDYNAGQGSIRNGLVTSGKLRGFSMYKTNNIAATSNAAGKCIAGHISSTATAQTITSTEVLRDPSSFGDIVRGLHVYGAKVLRDEALVSAFYGID